MKFRVAVPESLKRLPGGGSGGRAAGGGSFAQRLAAQGPQVATVVLAAAIAAQLALLAWKFLPGQQHPKAPRVEPRTPHATLDVGTLLGAHLFGEAPASSTGTEATPMTRVALVLVGTIAATDPEKGLAIVGESAQSAHVYAVGAMMPGGVKLHAVYADRIVLDRSGSLETLPLPRQLAAGTGIVQPMAQAAVESARAGDGTEPPIAESVQRLISQSPEVVGEVMRPMPVFAGGQLQGFRLYPGRDRQKFSKLGLQPGDVVTQVNGVPLTDPQRGMEILRGLGNAGTATVSVERGGAAQQITINASQIAELAGGNAAAQPND